MDYLVVSLVALFVSGLTLISGFGLGTVLMPAFAVFFPVPVAIAATAVVHFANNLFKLALVGRHADWSVVRRFGIPAAIAAAGGAVLLGALAAPTVIASYTISNKVHEITVLKLVIGALIAGFALIELSPRLAALSFPPRYLALGGLLSGFFGGLSGNQGAFRSAFLLRTGLGKEAFVATGVVSAVIVDTARLAVYGMAFVTSNFATLPPKVWGVAAAATVAAFAGAVFGARLLKKVTLRFVQLVVASAMIVLGLTLMTGLV